HHVPELDRGRTVRTSKGPGSPGTGSPARILNAPEGPTLTRSLRAILVNLPGLRTIMRRAGRGDDAAASSGRRPNPDRRMTERLEAQRRIERHISEQLDLEQLLVITVESAVRLIGGTACVVYLRDRDVLVPRAWTAGTDWIRDVRVPVGS